MNFRPEPDSQAWPDLQLWPTTTCNCKIASKATTITCKITTDNSELKVGPDSGRTLRNVSDRIRAQNAELILINGNLKGALNPNFLNLTINRENFWL